MAWIHKTVLILIGSLFVATGVNVFLIHHYLLDGGTFGIGLMFHYLTGVKVGLIVITISTPIFIFGWFYNRTFFFNSVHGMLFSSFLIDFLYHPLVNLGDSFHLNPWISSIVGGVLIGFGTGLMLRFETSIGGTDLLGQIIANYASLNPGIIIFIIDLIIIIMGTFLIADSSFVLSAITIICVGIMTSLVSTKGKKVSV